ncbi:MAG TPA: double-strand break repair protein AddB, partial [Alphaproteobacteria bacterium]|nr:double-strand break repair protein AddB [Alphaproteobacteria bacterium]
MRIYTIAPGRPFLDDLTDGILQEVGGDPLALSRCTVLLPTRRACRALREAFLRRAGGRPMLLPRLSPIGDIDSEALSLSLEDLPVLAETFELDPAISGLRRQLLLTRLILARPDMEVPPDQAAWLAAELGKLIDEVVTERLSFERL